MRPVPEKLIDKLLDDLFKKSLARASKLFVIARKGATPKDIPIVGVDFADPDGDIEVKMLVSDGVCLFGKPMAIEESWEMEEIKK